MRKGIDDGGLIWLKMEGEETISAERLVSRSDLALWSGLPDRHPLVGLFHRFGGIRKLNSAYGRIAHLPAADFIDEVFNQLGVRLEWQEEDWAKIPVEGPFVVVSNHPFGVLDALALIRSIQKVRPDFKLGVESLLADTPSLGGSMCVVIEVRIMGGSAPVTTG